MTCRTGRAGRGAVCRAAAPYLFLLPSLVFLAAFTYYPVAVSAYLSFFEWNLTTPERLFVGLENFRRLWENRLFWTVVRNNLVYAVGTIPTTMVLGLWLAVLLNQRLRANGFYRAAFFYPTVIPMVAAAMLWLFLFNPGIGLINYYGTRYLGLPRLEWLFDPDWAMPAIIIMSVWKHLGYDMLIFLAGLQNIPDHLYEAARIEGAGPWARFRHVTFPLLTPTTFFVTIVSVISSFQVFDQVYIMTQGGPADSTNVLVYYIYQQAFRFWDLGTAAALTTVLVLGLLAVIAFLMGTLGRRVFYQ